MAGGDFILVITRDDYAALMAAIADVEQTVSDDGFGECSFWTDGEYGRGGGEEITVAELLRDATTTLSRIASDLDQQAQGQE